MNIVVAPQINIQTGLNLAVLSPGAQQTLGQVAGNNLGANQGGGAAPKAAAGGQGGQSPFLLI
ncbi:MAG: hypothetical protein AB7R89_14765 [Dehalococcoidia bacterium]